MMMRDDARSRPVSWRRLTGAILAVGVLGTVAAGLPASEAANQFAKREADTTPIHPNLRYYVPPTGHVKRETMKVDVCVYGGTASGVVAAVQAARDGRSVVLVAPEQHLGGLTTGGLSWTDFGNKASIGGISREVYRRFGKKYGVEEEWLFEPKVALEVLNEMIAEAKVPVKRLHFLKSVKKQNRRLVSLTTERGLTVEAKMFIDTTYEGDLMAKAGVKYHVGRESNDTYGETLNGVQVRDKHQFHVSVSPYVVENDPTSGLLPGINPKPVAPQGSGDKLVQAYNFRLILTQEPGNRIPFAKPEGYDRRQYELLARCLRAGQNDVFGKFDPIRGKKVDKNNHGAVSTDFIGANHNWPEADYKTREKIFRQHVIYQQGLFWFLANDPAVPEEIRRRMQTWGLCKDEFTDTGGWSRQLYIREARRMISDHVVTEHDCRGTRKVDDGVGLGSYGMDSHNCQRVIIDGKVMNEGDVQVHGFPPYPISYRAIRPKREQCENLLVPVCLSSSHIAFGSARMEPVFMILGQSAAVAASLALDGDGVVQNVDYSKLRSRLLDLGQILEPPARGQSANNRAKAPLITPSSLPGVVLDDADGHKRGVWHDSSRAGDRKVGTGYLHDNNEGKGQAHIEFTPDLPETREYEIVVIAPANPNRASNVPVTIRVAGGQIFARKLDQKGEDGGNAFRSLGKFRLPAGKKTTVIVSNIGTDGYVVIDGIQFLPR